MSFAIRWIASKQFLFIDFLFLVVFGLALYFAWPSMPAFSKYLALAMTATMIALLFVGVVFLAGQAFFTLAFTHKKRDIDIRVYEQSQLGPLPLSSLPDTKIVAEPDGPKYLTRPKPEMLTAKQREMKYRNPVRNPFGNDAKLISQPFQQPVAKEKRTEISDGEKRQATREIIPPEIENEIIRLHDRGLKNTEIRDTLHISGERYWMIKNVVDNLDS